MASAPIFCGLSTKASLGRFTALEKQLVGLHVEVNFGLYAMICCLFEVIQPVFWQVGLRWRK
jgi:hypothetical protein